jgi:hypothetical protein
MTREDWDQAEALAHKIATRADALAPKIATLAGAEEMPVPIFAEALCAVIGGIVSLAAPEDRERVINQLAAAAWRGSLQ